MENGDFGWFYFTAKTCIFMYFTNKTMTMHIAVQRTFKKIYVAQYVQLIIPTDIGKGR